MKKTKIFSALLLALILIVGLLPLASSAENTGTITVTETREGQIYNAYYMAELAGASGDKYSYKIVPAWEKFFADEGIAFDPITKYITYNGNITDVAAFATAAVAYAKANNIAPAATKTVAEGQTSVTIEGLSLGYYCVDSTVGTVCALDTVNPSASLSEKNPPVTITKSVKEDSRGTYGPQNDDSVGKTVEYRSSVVKRAGAINYVITDTMAEGLTFNPQSVALYYYNSADVKVDLTYALETEFDENSRYAGKTFIVKLDNGEIAALPDGTRIILDYTATINEKAVIGPQGNENVTTIQYGHEPYSESEPSKTITYVWDFGVYKFELVNAAQQALAGAKFQFLTKTDSGETVHTFDYLGKVDGVDTYRYNPKGEVTEFTSDDTGLFKIVGIDSGEFWLRETEAPAGYNKITYDIEVDLMITGDYTSAGERLVCTLKNAKNGNVEVQNSTGVVLPSTGGTGTVIFIAVGMTLVVAMGVLLVVKKRMTKVVYTR